MLNKTNLTPAFKALCIPKEHFESLPQNIQNAYNQGETFAIKKHGSYTTEDGTGKTKTVFDKSTDLTDQILIKSTYPQKENPIRSFLTKHFSKYKKPIKKIKAEIWLQCHLEPSIAGTTWVSDRNISEK